MKHEEIRHKLSEFIDGAMTSGEKTVIEQHLKTCTECSSALRELRKTIEHIHAIEEVEPPAWMTQKIMATVRTEAEEEEGLWPRVFAPLLTKFPVQAVAVIFLTVTAYYIFNSINPAQKYADEPVGMLAKKDAPTVKQMREEDKTVRETAPEPTQAPRKPGYKSLDMKYEYEKPATPLPQDRTVASAPAPAKDLVPPMVSGVADATGKRAEPPRTAAPSVMTEQAGPATGAVQHTEARRDTVSDEQKTGKALSADTEAEALLDVTEHFVKVDLPEKMKKKGLQYRVRKYETGLADLAWLRKTNSFRANPCSSRYVVDVDLSGMLSKYLYCYDHIPIRLLGIFELQQDTWSEKRQ